MNAINVERNCLLCPHLDDPIQCVMAEGWRVRRLVLLSQKRGVQIAPKGVLGLPWHRGSHVDESTISAPGALLDRSGGADGLWGPLWGAPGGTLETFWELLGSFRGTFGEHFLSAKQFFAISNRKA